MYSSEDMSEDRKSRYISYLVGRVNEVELDKKAMGLVLADYLHAQKVMTAKLAELSMVLGGVMCWSISWGMPN